MMKLKLYFLKTIYWLVKFFKVLLGMHILYWWFIFIAFKYSIHSPFNLSISGIVADSIATIILCSLYIGKIIEKQKSN